jgi:hypothetical protein
MKKNLKTLLLEQCMIWVKHEMKYEYKDHCQR